MRRTLRFLWNVYMGTVLGCVLLPGAVTLVCSEWLHIEFFATYYYLLPMLMMVYVGVFSFNLPVLYRNMALSFNARRTDFFWGGQVAFLITGVAGTALTWLIGALPGLLGLEYAFHEANSFMNGAPLFTQPAVALFLLAASLLLQPIGAALGELYLTHKLWGTIGLVVIMFLACGGTVALMFLGDGTIPVASQIVKTVFTVILGVLGVVCAVCEVYYFRCNRKAMVR